MLFVDGVNWCCEFTADFPHTKIGVGAGAVQSACTIGFLIMNILPFIQLTQLITHFCNPSENLYHWHKVVPQSNSSSICMV